MDSASLKAIAFACLCLALLPLPAPAARAADGVADFTVDVSPGAAPLETLQVSLRCGPAGALPDGPATALALVAPGASHKFSVATAAAGDTACLLGAAPVPGLQFRYLGDGGSAVEIRAGGCLFSGVQPGHANFCQLRLASQATSVTVYKKWIGASGAEPDVAAQLYCAGRLVEPRRMINAGQPGSWDLEGLGAEGVQCEVTEARRPEFNADTSDCRELLIRPGAQEECTVVNTKVVKMIQMLNRYGLFIMIGVFMAAGMIAARKAVP